MDDPAAPPIGAIRAPCKFPLRALSRQFRNLAAT
jgi:hypothetical protein